MSINVENKTVSEFNVKTFRGVMEAKFCQGVQNADPIHHLLGGCKMERGMSQISGLCGHIQHSCPWKTVVAVCLASQISSNVSENVRNKVLHVQPEFKSLENCVSGVRCEFDLENTLEDC
ncbi:hypothetical protein KQX54_016771 [Cotesia glomerata]|uniref:Uncharacterized protein n=1 Tax=Cotesia glomerata TaxID=32391 RepID=A0AAV7J909_COTGL|nr:hypothetical protein KQX54_016771 [Cotesia glomerata]